MNSDFAVTTQRITSVAPHPNADRLEIAHVLGYQCVVRKGLFSTGDLIIYIPERSLVPLPVQEVVGCVGYLSGTAKDRVKPVRLRGELSQGLICQNFWNFSEEGLDVTKQLDITKYVPPVPAALSGQVFPAGSKQNARFGITNIKNYPSVIKDGDHVVITEKIHGTWCQIGVYPDGSMIVTSKGLANRQLALKESDENLYWRVARHVFGPLIPKLQELDFEGPVFFLGEVFGLGVQDLHYGASTGTDKSIGYRIFDINVGGHVNGWLGEMELSIYCDMLGLNRVPILYDGPFSEEILAEFRDGNESVSGTQANIREGVVIRTGRHDEHRLMKAISEHYLTRKGGTEYN